MFTLPGARGFTLPGARVFTLPGARGFTLPGARVFTLPGAKVPECDLLRPRTQRRAGLWRRWSVRECAGMAQYLEGGVLA